MLREALACVQGFLLEPAAPGRETEEVPEVRRQPAGVEAVVLGMSAGCGVSTVARGLARALELPGERLSEVRAVGGEESDGPVSLVARRRPCGVVWDVRSNGFESMTTAATRADAVVLVAQGSGNPPLAEVVKSMLAERFARVVLVANRVTDPARWVDRSDVCIPESKVAAALLGRGIRPSGSFGAALARLAAVVEGGH